ncbi:IS21-like element helper ATPase IstB [Rectinema subterraneum]|jgi:DNA replication protein DnaC|uniref:IS21-like element helper ATPase IstB n=1 Tax=Rectinema subterraneum TaxID=2653714 RepID=UPI00131BCDA1|nr:IS21-like element helper ATPase IstB [Rectinema subterraneum]
MVKDDLITELKRLRLPAMADNLDVRASQAEEGKLGYLEFTQLLVQDELASRESNSFQKRLKSAGVSNRMTFETFDFEFNNAVFPAQTIRDLASCRFIDQHRNLVLAGPPGIGKSHIAHAVGHEAARRGLDVVVFKTHKLLERLAPDRFSTKKSQILMKRCINAGLLILDDFAFRLYSQQETELLYTLSDERLQEGSIVITSNRPPEDWFSIFPDQIVGGAIMDRLVSGAVKLIVTSGRSFRKEGALRNQISEPAA